jgi:hypothetical protein
MFNHSREGEVMSNVTTAGIDLAKNVFSVHGVDANGRQVLRRTVRRDQLLAVVAQWPPCLIGMEACSGVTPDCKAGDVNRRIVSLSKYQWQPHCRGLYQLPVAA